MQRVFLLARLAAVAVASTDGGTCSGDGRATKYDSCSKCGWRIHAPKTPGQYTLMRKYETVQEMRDGWVCFMGQTGYPDPEAMHTQPHFKERFGRGYFWDTGEPPLHHDTQGLPWLTDPTAGMNKYDMGCKYLNDLLVPREDHKPGFSLKAMRPSSLGGYDFPDLNEAYTLRLESKDVVNGGLFVIDVDWLPYGAGVWPAFWMVGSDPEDWILHPPKTPGMGLRNYWPYRGEIDIIEYTNAYTVEEKTSHGWRNHVTLHTECGCYSNRSTPSGRGDLSAGDAAGGSDCCAGNAFTGCSVSMGENTVGHPGFQGALYVCDWVQDSHIDCWFFNKNASGTYAPDGTFDFPESNWANPPPDPHLAYLTVALNFKEGTGENVPAAGHALLLYEVSTGKWVATFQPMAYAGYGSGTWTRYEARYGAVYPDYTRTTIAFGTHAFRIYETSDTHDWSIERTESNLHTAGGAVAADYSITISHGGTYTMDIPITYNTYPYTTLGTATTDIPAAPTTTPPPPPPYPNAPYHGEQYGRTSPIDFKTATSVNVADLGPPDVRHDLSQQCHSRQGPPIDYVFSDMRFILNTVVCGQWAGNLKTTSMPEDPEQMSYVPQYDVEGTTPECDDAVRSYIGSKMKRNGNRDYLHRRFDWDISFIKIYT